MWITNDNFLQELDNFQQSQDCKLKQLQTQIILQWNLDISYYE